MGTLHSIQGHQVLTTVLGEKCCLGLGSKDSPSQDTGMEEANSDIQSLHFVVAHLILCKGLEYTQHSLSTKRIALNGPSHSQRN